MDYMRYSDVSDISKDDVRCPNIIHSFMTTAGGGRWYVDVAPAVVVKSSCCLSMVSFSSLLLKTIPLLTMSVAAYTDAVMLFVGPSFAG